jgi:hypothetical protein
MTDLFRRTPLVAARAAAGGVVLLAAALAAPLALANSCQSRCDSNYYFCNRGGASPGERSCATGRSTCYTRCRGSDGPSYGAIAFSGSADVHGFSRNHASRAGAEAEALGHCRAWGRGAADCRVLVWFHDRCAALATGSNGAHGSAQAPQRRTAAQQALAACRPFGGESCKIVRDVCSPS